MSVTGVVHECYRSVTGVLQECYRSVTGVLQECYLVIRLLKQYPQLSHTVYNHTHRGDEIITHRQLLNISLLNILSIKLTNHHD